MNTNTAYRHHMFIYVVIASTILLLTGCQSNGRGLSVNTPLSKSALLGPWHCEQEKISFRGITSLANSVHFDKNGSYRQRLTISDTNNSFGTLKIAIDSHGRWVLSKETLQLELQSAEAQTLVEYPWEEFFHFSEYFTSIHNKQHPHLSPGVSEVTLRITGSNELMWMGREGLMTCSRHSDEI
ncbi:hypothetical protein EKG38_10765 [Shewanella canadensis]|uniref:Uncharacterized protein n=1 Tax=Shewanella canadensis TaxID=271096 RepID=A0A431WT71_9GAMM|nr:hypothetical protein [Shewanella canadensis]RTR38653.1 hypothetical protein EKG38_10765 [Shewanella canadensis]